MSTGYARIDLYKQPAIELNFIEEALLTAENQYWKIGYTGKKK